MFKKLAATMAAAITYGNAAELICSLMLINHRGRLERLFQVFARRFLEAHAQAMAHPQSRTAAKRAQRAKAVVDVIRYRLAVIGQKRHSDKALMALAARTDLPRLVHSRKAPQPTLVHSRKAA